MSKFLKKISWMKQLVPAVLVIAVIGVSVGGYQKPTYTIPMVKEETTDANHLEEQEIEIEEELQEEVEEEQEENQTYQDGTYTGTATGFGGVIKVQVTIKEGKMSAITVVEAASETPGYLARAKGVIQTILSTQSTSVDAISGATFTSKGIINAVKNALRKAAGQAVVDATTAPKKEESEEIQVEISEDSTPGAFPYIDGTFYGTGNGFAGKIKVALTIKNQTITSIVVSESKDDPAFLKKASAILKQVVSNQTLEVDTVSGATYSSNGLIEAIQHAMKAAEKATLAYEQGTEIETEESEEIEEEQPEVNVPEDSEENNAGDDLVTENNTGKVYQDGIYYVTATCTPDRYQAFGAYTLSMKVTIKKDLITNISEVSGSGELYLPINDTFIRRAVEGTTTFKGVVGQILSQGTVTDIDTVTGATRTSYAIMEATKSALQAAKIQQGGTGNGDKVEPTDTPSNTAAPSVIPSPTAVPTEAPQVTVEPSVPPSVTPSVEPTMAPTPEPEVEGERYKNGTYSVVAKCYPDDWEEFFVYDLSMNVKIVNDRIVAITDLDGSGQKFFGSNYFYINIAANGNAYFKGVVTQIVETGEVTEIDAVSGATCASEAIIRGAQSALEKAKK